MLNVSIKITDSDETMRMHITLRKHAYSNMLKISPQKTENFQTKILIFFTFLLKT